MDKEEIYEEKRKSNNLILIIIVGIVLLLLGGFIGFYLGGGMNESFDTPEKMILKEIPTRNAEFENSEIVIHNPATALYTQECDWHLHNALEFLYCI